MNEFEYYLIGSDGDPSVPLLRADGDQSTWFLFGNEPVEVNEKVELCFNNPIPTKPEMVDYHSMPNAVISKKIHDVLLPLDINGIQLVPAVIRNNKTDDLYEDYWIIYIYNKIECLDRVNSEYTVDEDDEDKIEDIEKLVLDKEILNTIPLENRLIFLLKEGRSKRIYHKSIVDAIMATNPRGIRFYPIEEWYDGIQFQR